MQETRVQSLVGKTSQRRAWQPTLVFLPGESHGQRSQAGYSPWGHKEPDTTLHDTKMSDTMSVWSEGKLTSTALGRLQSEHSDLRDSVEKIQEKMEEMNLYDNLDDEEEKQTIKNKNKDHKNDRSQKQIFLDQPTVPLVEPTLSILKPLGMMDLLLNHR